MKMIFSFLFPQWQLTGDDKITLIVVVFFGAIILIQQYFIFRYKREIEYLRKSPKSTNIYKPK
jgi:hypothetical protein